VTVWNQLVGVKVTTAAHWTSVMVALPVPANGKAGVSVKVMMSIRVDVVPESAWIL